MVDSEMHTVSVLRGWVPKGPVNIEAISSDVRFILTPKACMNASLWTRPTALLGNSLRLPGPSFSLLDVVQSMQTTHNIMEPYVYLGITMSLLSSYC